MRYLQRIHMNVHLDRLRGNLRRILAIHDAGTKLCMVIKADAYGFGAEDIAKNVEDIADFYAVTSVQEVLQLRASGVSKPILVLGYVWPEDYEDMLRMNVRFNVYREEDAVLLSHTAAMTGRTAHIHFALETGMNRIGFPADEATLEAMLRISRMPNIDAEGLFTHFAMADARDLGSAYRQLSVFNGFVQKLKERGLTIPILHTANSAASLVMPEASFTMLRVGIAAYGYYPSDEIERTVRLEPVMEFKSHVTYVKQIQKGEGVSYGYSYVAPEPRWIATVPVGYADGYTRLLSDKGEVLIRGKRAIIRGHICMDQMMVDVTDIPGVSVGDEVTLIGRDGEEEITLGEIEKRSGLLSYEILCGLSRRRVPKAYMR